MSDPSQSTMNTVTDYAKELTFTKDLQGFLAGMQPNMNHPLVKMFVPFSEHPLIFSPKFLTVLCRLKLLKNFILEPGVKKMRLWLN